MTPEDETIDHQKNEKDLNPQHHEEGQMHADEFIGEVIQIGKLKRFCLDVNLEANFEERVRCEAVVDLPSAIGGGYYEETFVHYSRTMGFAMRAVRESIREEAGG